MAEEFEGQDLSDAVFWGVDLSGARFRDVNMTNVVIKNAWLKHVDIDALVDHLVINGVDVTQYINDHDAWYPLRMMLRPEDPDGMRAAWAALEETWDKTIGRARQLTEQQLHESVGGEWSFVNTLRHLLMAHDKWFSAPILGDEQFHPFGVPNSGSADFGWPGLDPSADPTFDEVLAVRGEHAARLREYLVALETGGPRRVRSRCSRTAPCRSTSASTPCSRRSSSTIATPFATSHNWSNGYG